VPSSAADIVLLTEVYPPAIGGSGTLLENLYCRLGGTTVHVLTHGEGSRVQRGLEVDTVRMGAPTWGVFEPASFRRHLRVAGAVNRLRRPGHTVVHCAKALPEGLSARFASWRGGGPYVCWVHGEELGHMSTSNELTWLARRVYQGATAVFANSENSRQLLTAGWGVPDSRVHVIHPGVDVDRFRPDVNGTAERARIGACPGDVVFLSVGRLDRRKGHDMALRALARVRRVLPAIKYGIVGDGPQRAGLEALAAEVGVADLVHFAGAVGEADLPAWYAASDVFLMPNRADGVDFEGFGIVFLEAAAAGKPSIGGRSGGVVEAIDDGITGLLVDGTSEESLATAMIQLASSPAARLSIGGAGRQRVLESFTWQVGASRVAEIHRACR
jgi:phosphatidylinositol alpha-1,6-mannosyltransferase